MARFGVHEVQPGQELDNSERLANEMADLLGVWALLEIEGVVPPLGELGDRVLAKSYRVEEYLECSRACGRLE